MALWVAFACISDAKPASCPRPLYKRPQDPSNSTSTRFPAPSAKQKSRQTNKETQTLNTRISMRACACEVCLTRVAQFGNISRGEKFPLTPANPKPEARSFAGMLFGRSPGEKRIFEAQMLHSCDRFRFRGLGDAWGFSEEGESGA